MQADQLLGAAQEQALSSNSVKFHVDRTIPSPLCMMCGEKGEIVGYIFRRFRNQHRRNLKDITKKSQNYFTGNYVKKTSLFVVENGKVKLLWDSNIQCNNVIKASKPGHCYHEKDKQSL